MLRGAGGALGPCCVRSGRGKRCLMREDHIVSDDVAHSPAGEDIGWKMRPVRYPREGNQGGSSVGQEWHPAMLPVTPGENGRNGKSGSRVPGGEATWIRQVSGVLEPRTPEIPVWRYLAWMRSAGYSLIGEAQDLGIHNRLGGE